MKITIPVCICLQVFIFGIGLGQRQITTLSGQKIILFQNGTWIKTDTMPMVRDSFGMLVTDRNPMQEVRPEGMPLNEKTREGIEILKKAAEKKEIETCILMDLLDKELAVKEVQLSQARQMKNKESETIVKADIADLRNKQKTAEKIYKLDAQLVVKANELKNLKNSDLNNQLLSLGEALNIEVSSFLTDLKSNSDEQPITSGNVVKKTAPVIDKCSFAKIEKAGKLRIIETKAEPLFVFTPENLKAYFREKDLMMVNASVLAKGKDHYLHLTIKIISKDAAKNYGHIMKESMLRVQFISGTNINLNASEDTYGYIEQYTGYMVYNAFYRIKNEDLGIISKMPIDFVGIMWSSGFEKYDIFNVDVVMNHLSCIKSAKK